MSASIITSAIFAISAWNSAHSFELPTIEGAHDFIEKGDSKHPVKAVFSCHKNFDDYPLTGNVIAYQDSISVCDRVNEKLDCVFDMFQRDQQFRDNCLWTDVDSLHTCFNEAGYGAIGYPTQFWETVAWHEMQTRGFIVAISSDETNQICGENKAVFNQWMHDNGYSRFMPKTYKSPEEAQMPCVIKLRPITGTDSNGVVIAKTTDEMWEALKKAQIGEPPLIQEAIISKAEVVVYFIAYQGRLLNRVSCRVSYKDDPLTLMNPKLRGTRFRAKCKNVPGFNDQIRPFMREISEKLKINGMAFINLKLVGIDSDMLFYGEADIVREWKRKHVFPKDDSFVKIIEIHARVGGGLQSDPKTFSKMIRAYHLAHFSAAYNQNNYDHALYATHYRKQHKGDDYEEKMYGGNLPEDEIVE